MTRISYGSHQDKWLRYTLNGATAADPTNEVQRLVVDAGGGTFDTVILGVSLTNQAYNITAANLKAAWVAGGGPTGDLTITGGPGSAGGATPYVFTYIGAQAGRNVTQLTADATNLTGGAGTATASTTTAGGTAVVVDMTDENGVVTKIPQNSVMLGFIIDPDVDFTTPGGTPTIKLGVDDTGLGDDVFKAATNYNNAQYLTATQVLTASGGIAKKVSKSGGAKVIATIAAAALTLGTLHVHVNVRAASD